MTKSSVSAFDPAAEIKLLLVEDDIPDDIHDGMALLRAVKEQRRPDCISVSLPPVAGGPQWRLSVSDSGAGLAADFEVRRESSLGLKLVSDLAHQMAGHLLIGSGPAAEFSVIFSPPQLDANRESSRL
ncbi:hypothetical protein [Roseateles sp.]|uniref:hypothetical protein n=1 Tax=Roseateles sp. TaxID=1971397 RepID=UPI00286A87C8|nr:hypothetical protein [Roseateles sp.]